MDFCEQIHKASDFIFHYQDHKNFDGDSFVEYAFEELFGENHDNSTHHNDSNQNHPTHTNNQCCHALIFITPNYKFTVKTPNLEEQKQANGTTSHFSSRYLDSLFQPPRV